jgi:hypothetical protein
MTSPRFLIAAEPEDDSGSSETSADVNLAHLNLKVYEMAEVFDVEAINAESAQAYIERADIAAIDAKTEPMTHRDADFRGIAIETCCTGASVCSEAEYRRYCRAACSEYVCKKSASKSFPHFPLG